MIDPPLPGASLEAGPLDWQVLQQNAAGEATLELAGVYRVDAPRYRVEARVVSEVDGAPVAPHLDWRPADLLSGQRWRMSLDRIPAGGLYRLETRVWRTDCPDPRPTRGDYVHHLGVGDLWVIAGQSNASGTGLGQAADPPVLGVHLFGNDEQWKLATHPLEDATRSLHPITVHGVFQGHSPWLAFGRALLDELGHPIGLIPTALGGSPLSSWEPAADGPLYANMRDMIRAAGRRVRGVVWYQGESDCEPGLWETYEARFRGFLAALREHLGEPELPILTAQLGRYTGDVSDGRDRWWTALREAQRRLARDLPAVALVPTVDLPLSDEVHVSTAGNVTLGRRFAAAALREAYGREAVDPGVRLLAVELLASEPPKLRLWFERPPSGWCRPGAIRDLQVTDAAGEVTLVEVLSDDEGWVDLVLGRSLRERAVVHCHPGCDPACDLRDRDQRPVVAFSVEVGGPV